MGIVIGISRYLLPVLTVIILFKCFLTLLAGHPVNKTYGYIVNRANGEKLALNTWETSIGKSKSCDITLTTGDASRFHAVVCRRVKNWYLYDTMSKSGTFVNGERIEKEAIIKNADEISFGNTSFYFIVTDDPVIQVGKKRRSKSRDVPNEAVLGTGEAQRAETKRPAEKKTGTPYDMDFRQTELDIHPKRQEKSTYSGKTEDVYSGSEKIKEAPKRKKQAACIREEDGSVFVLCSSNITVGRGYGSDIKLQSLTVSRNHAVLIKSGEKWYISDSGSTAGTVVNGEKIRGSKRLYNGDMISLGNERLRFTDDYR